ncbi:MAG: CRISPR-associated helicase Cas3' [Rhodobacteraceae bacterium]|nr:CRISPR-associated helicase Cas3' [Paracoccaceae bacterium]
MENASYNAWGKADRLSGDFHHLAHHCADVAAVFGQLIHLPILSQRLAQANGGALSDTDLAQLQLFAFLHDVGKLHPGFQAKARPQLRTEYANHLTAAWELAGLAEASPEILDGVISKLAQWGRPTAELWSAMLAHHGSIVDAPYAKRESWKSLPGYDWRKESVLLGRAARAWFAPAFAATGLPAFPPRFVHLFAGLLALADWLGSDRAFFPFRAAFEPTYWDEARARAGCAVAKVGLASAGRILARGAAFSAVSGHAKPQPAQGIIGHLPTDTRLVILEAETGSGKTEAALWRFARLYEAGEVDGLYFALPTRSAARQMFARVREAVQRMFADAAPAVVLAIPGTIAADEANGRRLPDWSVLWDDAPEKAASRWAAEHATRFLAAAVAVGTVDQAMLAALRVKHAHMRGSALSRSLLVIDEVHASDRYMSTIQAALVTEHIALGGHAMLMSATLGSAARVRWTGGSPPDPEAARLVPYPAVWCAGEASPRHVKRDAAAHDKRISVSLVETMAADALAKRAVAAAREGARVLVVRNTVDAAVAAWEAVCQAAEDLVWQVAGGPALHHGRFAAEDRALLDRSVEEVLGKGSRSAGGCIVVGTQTLEQSLDIDADFLISDLCPIDVLLQRAGRLHRHQRTRPVGFETPQLLVAVPEGGLDRLAAPTFENGLGAWREGNALHGVYIDLAGLEATRRLIEAHPHWSIPDMNRQLVEDATHPERLEAIANEMGETWERYHFDVVGKEISQAMAANGVRLDRTRRFSELNPPGDEEAIKTRIGAAGIVLALDVAGPAPIGPFGLPVTRLALPARWSKGLIGDETPEITAVEGTLWIAMADRLFQYDRRGLYKPKAAS